MTGTSPTTPGQCAKKTIRTVVDKGPLVFGRNNTFNLDKTRAVNSISN